MPITAPDLEIRNEEQLAAEAIGKVSGGITTDRIRQQIAEREELLKIIEAGNLPSQPVCPELTNANPSSPHTVLLEAQAWLLAQLAHRINLIPVQNQIEFHNLFGIEQRPAAAAEAVLRFSVSGVPLNTDVIVPEGTQVSDKTGAFVFETSMPLTIEYGDNYGDVIASRTVTGQTLLSPNVLTSLIDSPAFVSAVTNPAAIDSGNGLESVDSALERARSYQRRAERLVTAIDYEEAILQDALNNNGIVKAFPEVVAGAFDEERQPGFLTIVAMTRTGNVVDDQARQNIAALLEQTVGNVRVSVSDPVFIEFDVSVRIRLTTGAQELAVKTAIEANLRAAYGARYSNFGKRINRSDLIAIIENTAGVSEIVPLTPDSPILIQPVADQQLDVWKLPKLVAVTITVV